MALSLLTHVELSYNSQSSSSLSSLSSREGFSSAVSCIPVLIQGGPKMVPFLYALTLSNINRFSKLFNCQNQEKICNNTITKDPNTPQVYSENDSRTVARFPRES